QSPLVLLDDPFCALDEEVAKQVCRSLLSPTSGLLRPERGPLVGWLGVPSEGLQSDPTYE
ncbi:ABCC2, partial [Symbiodinium necroappetens]